MNHRPSQITAEVLLTPLLLFMPINLGILIATLANRDSTFGAEYLSMIAVYLPATLIPSAIGTLLVEKVYPSDATKRKSLGIALACGCIVGAMSAIALMASSGHFVESITNTPMSVLTRAIPGAIAGGLSGFTTRWIIYWRSCREKNGKAGAEQNGVLKKATAVQFISLLLMMSAALTHNQILGFTIGALTLLVSVPTSIALSILKHGRVF